MCNCDFNSQDIGLTDDFRHDDSDIDLNDLLEILFGEDVCDDN